MYSALSGVYDHRLIALSLILAILPAYAALDLTGRAIVARGWGRRAWLGCGALAMGSGIWAMHYVALQALRLPVPVDYDWPTVLLSLLVAIAASFLALSFVSRSEIGRSTAIAGSVCMGAGIAATYYIAVDAMRFPAIRVYSPGLVALSVVLAMAICWIALSLAFASADTTAITWRKAGSGLVLGLAIPVMHASGTAAVRFLPSPWVQGSVAYTVSVFSLGLAGIAGVTLLLLALVFIPAALDRRKLSTQSELAARSQIEMEAVFDTMSEAIVVVDRDLGTVNHNRAASHLLGLTRHILSVDEIAAVFEGSSPTGAAIAFDDWPIMRALRGDYSKNSEVTIRKKDTGEMVTVEISTAPLRSPANVDFGVIVSLRDIGERVQMDEARKRLIAIVESSEDAIIGKDVNGIVKSWNRGAEKIFGYSADEMIGQSLLRLLPPDREHEEDEILRRIKTGAVVEHFETLRKRKDGELIHVSLMISPVKDSGGRVIGASKIARDITERKRLEQQLQQSQKMDALGQLTGGIAHDFNNLLAIIVGNLDLLECLLGDNPIALNQVRASQRAAARGADLTRRLLTFARMEALKPASVSLNASIQTTVALAARTLGPEIAITTALDDSLPHVFVDSSGLESALLNLMVNARDAMPGGGAITVSTHLVNLDATYPSVQTTELNPGWYACVSVSDNGHGMTKEVRERAFEPFFTTKPRNKGTGLGLAMIYGFVKQSGGLVRIYSEPGLGTTVNMYLPLVQATLEPEVVPDELIWSAPPGLTVLVVDDEPDLLTVALAYLAEIGCQGLKATDGAAALDILQREPKIELVITDIIMPRGMSGAELAQRVHALNPSIKVIYTSGFPADALQERNMALAEGPLLRKPYQRAEFRAMVRSVVQGTTTRTQ